MLTARPIYRAIRSPRPGEQSNWPMNWLASGGGGKDHDIHLWEPLKGEETYIYNGHHAPINAISWSPNGQRIASASSDGTVHIWQGSP